MPHLLEFLRSVVLRVDASGVVDPIDSPTAAWLGDRPRTVQALCGVPDLSALIATPGPWRVVALPEGEHLLIGIDWHDHDTLATRLADATLQDRATVLNVLPTAVASDIAVRVLQPKAYRESTLLFVDAVQFSRLAARVDPVSCLRQLDFYFSLFDAVTRAFGVEKMTTLGDAYMAIAGVPQRRAAHAVDATLAALRLVRAVATRPGPVVDDWEWSFRVGLHSGPCISGVVGAQPYSFDVWGETVSIAAHIQRVSRPDVVSVSAATAALIGEFFALEFDGTTTVRNAGEVELYLVRGVHPELLSDPDEIIVNTSFADRYLAAFGVPAPHAAWHAHSFADGLG